MGLSGVAFVGCDVGGFGNATAELFARWMGMLYPPHAWSLMTTARHEFGFGDRVERICREYIELRYRLPPHLYTRFGKQLQLVHRFYAHYYTIPQRFQHLHTLTRYCSARHSLHRFIDLNRSRRTQGTWYDWWRRSLARANTYPRPRATGADAAICPGNYSHTSDAVRR